MKSGLDAMPLFLLDDLLKAFVLCCKFSYNKSCQSGYCTAAIDQLKAVETTQHF